MVLTVEVRSGDGADPIGVEHLPAYAPGRSVPGAIKLASSDLAFPTLPAVAQAIADAAVHDRAASTGTRTTARPGW